jgi:Tol biopolymer transport system component
MKTKLCLVLALLLVLTEACTQLESKIIFESSDTGKLYTLQWGVKTEVNGLDLSCGNPSWSPNKKLIACQSGNKTIEVIDNLGTRLGTIADDKYSFDAYSWSPDNSHLIISGSTSIGDSGIFSVKFDGSDLTRLTNSTEMKALWPQWSPNGKFILYRSMKFNNKENEPTIITDNLVIIKPNGQEVFRFDLARISAFQLGSLPGVAANWSPDSMKLGLLGWYIIDIQANKIINLMSQNNTLCTNSPPTWSIDGSTLLFQAILCGDHNPDTWSDIYTIDTNGTNLKQLTNTEKAFLPWWSPDGRYIAYDSNVTGIWNIYLMKSDGSDDKNLTNSTNDVQFVDWLTP